MNCEEWLKWREEYFRKVKQWEEEETNRKEKRRSPRKKKEKRRASSLPANDRVRQFEMIKLKAKISNLESENKKLKKKLLTKTLLLKKIVRR